MNLNFQFINKLKKLKWYLLAISLIYFLFRIPFLSSWVNYSDDQGIALIEINNLIKDKKIPLVGPKVTTLGYEGRYFFHGPYEYYFLIPFFLINSDPISGSASIILLNFIGMVLFFLLLKRFTSSINSTLLTILFYSHPFIIAHTTFIWNPNYLLLITNLILFLLYLKKINIPLKNFLLGFLVAVGVLLHYQYILWLLFFFFYYLIKKRYKKLLYFLLGLAIGGMPMIVFELRHNFYNFQTLFYVLANRVGENKSYPVYYFYSFFPLIYLFIVKKFNKIKTKYLTIGVSMLLIYFSIVHINNIYRVKQNWNLNLAKDVVKTIINQSPKNYNVVNLLTGDTRANAI